MPFKPNQTVNGPNVDKLRTILNQTKLSKDNNPLYQFCNSLLNNISSLSTYLQGQITTAVNNSSSSSTTITGADYVVASDGATPTPSPVNDGFGNFIYIQYEP